MAQATLRALAILTPMVRRVGRQTVWGGAVAAMLLVGGCGLISSGEAVGCPRIGALHDADRLTRFSSAGRNPSDIQFEAKIDGITGVCEQRSRNGLGVTLEIKLQVARGSAIGTERAAALELLIAHVGDNDRVIERFAVPVEVLFGPNLFRAEQLVPAEYEVRLPQDKSYRNHRIVVAIAMAEADLRFNRERTQR